MGEISKKFKWLLTIMTIGLIIFWMFIIVSESLILKKAYEDRAHETAVAYTKAIKDFRIWIARHDGVYVPTSEFSPPSPFLEEERLAITTDGKQLTKLNPAYASRQLAELSQENVGLNFRIVSADPVNEKNMADAWETSALTDYWDVDLYDDGDYAHVIETEADGSKTFRTIRPIYIVDECLYCHVEEGRTVGDLRGGISVSLDYTTYEQAWLDHCKRNTTNFLIAFASSLFVLVFFGRRIVSGLAEREALFEKIEHIAQTDKLTELANRYFFMMRLEIELRRFFRHQTPLVLLMVDLNKFKEINDNHGHAAGDQVLQKTAETLTASIRSTDVAARIGGDEFMVMLTDATREDGLAYAERLRLELQAAKVFYQGNKLDICASIGVAYVADVIGIDQGEANMDKIKDNFMHQADQAMYAAKAAHREKGGSHVRCYKRDCVSGVFLDQGESDPTEEN